MAIQAKKQNPWFIVLILIAGVVLWALEQRKEAPLSPKPGTRETAPASPAPREKSAREGNYEVFRNCTLAEDRTNDGDSFRILLPDGRKEIFRLYFVDTPESAFKSYANGENNHDRIRDQAGYFDISPEKAVEIGAQGKKFALNLLSSSPFTIYTRWDDPFGDRRYHAFVLVHSGGKQRWLHELLVEKGLARLKTKPAELPDGTSVADHRRHLEQLRAAAEKSGTGAWSASGSISR